MGHDDRSSRSHSRRALVDRASIQNNLVSDACHTSGPRNRVDLTRGSGARDTESCRTWRTSGLPVRFQGRVLLRSAYRNTWRSCTASRECERGKPVATATAYARRE